MTRSRRFGIATSIAAVVLAVGLVVSRLQVSRLQPKAAKFERRCAVVRLAMHMDATELADPALQQEASRRFYEPVAAHSYDEIMACAARPLDLSSHDRCLLTRDYSCLAELAHKAELAIEDGS